MTAMTTPSAAPLTGVAAELQGLIEEQYAQHAGNSAGALADYIPELAKVPGSQAAA